MRLPTPRGELTEQLVGVLSAGSAPVTSLTATATDETDHQLALWILHELHYRGFEETSDALEWDPDLIRLRGSLERQLEACLRAAVADDLAAATEQGTDLTTRLEHLTRDQPGRLAEHLAREASIDQFREFLVQRSIYHLKESDPHAWALPRLEGAAKVALAELLYDEYGAGVPERLHSRLFADALRAMGMDATYGAYIDDASWQTLAVNNTMTMFGLHRRFRGAVMGHLAAFEMTSSLPARRIAQGADRLSLDAAVVAYYDEHVEADAVHEHVAAGICASLVEDDPVVADDVLFGAAACVELDRLAAQVLLTRWRVA